MNVLPGQIGGRPKTISGQVRDALAEVERDMPNILAAMMERAKGEVECPLAVQQAAAEYLCDRIYGRPNQPLSGTGQFILLVKDFCDKERV